MLRNNLPLIAAVLSLILVVAAHADQNWSSFQNGGNISLTADETAGQWMLSDDIRWSTPLPGYGQSSPVVWDGKAYVTSVEGANKETYHVSAIDLANGEIVWDHQLANASPQESSNYVSKAAPTPTVDADGVIAFFEGGNLVALTHAGNVRWQRNLAEEFGGVESRHGLSASVEQNENAAFVWVERAEDPYVLAIDKKTGETIWKAAGVGATSWASPRLIAVGDEQHLVLSAIGSLTGLDAATGEKLWTLGDITGNSTPTPIPLGDNRFLIGATVGRGQADSGRASASNGVVEITNTDDGWKADYAWRSERATSSFGSPIAHDGMAYFVNQAGVVFALDLATGEEKFTERLAGSNWATPLAVGQTVFFFSKDGKVSLLSTAEDAPEVATWEQLPADPAEAQAQDRFGGSVLYGAAWTPEQILLRRGDTLFAVGVQQKS